jgi:outer membrane lipase/esterase
MHRQLSVATLLMGATALGGTFAAPAAAQDDPAFSEFTVFGDSLSDPGNIPFVTGANFPPAPYAANRFSNGPTWAELLPGLLNVDGPDVANVAVGGAFTGQLPTPAPLVGILGPTTGNLNAITQGPTINALFLLDGTDIGSQVTSYLGAAPGIGPDALFSVYGGANDYFLAASAIAADPANATALATAAINVSIQNLATSAGALAASGAKHVIVPNLPNLGATPAFSGDPQQAALGATISGGHNTLLGFAVAGLANDFDANFYVVDFASLFDDAIANPGKYGFSNNSAPCFTGISVCSSPDSLVFWDSVHPTAAGHRMMAAFAADTVIAPRTLPAQAYVGAANAASAQRQLTSALRAARHVGSPQKFLFADLVYDDSSREPELYAFGYDYDGYTLSAGVAGRPLPNLVAGGLIGFTTGEAALTSGTGEFDFDSVRVGGFLGVEAGMFEGNLALSYSDDDYASIERLTGVGGQVASADASGSAFAATLEGLVNLGAPSLRVSPLARVRFAEVSVGSYQESGAVGLNQGVEARELDSVDGELGAQLSGAGGAFWWRLEGVYVEQLDEPNQIVTSRLVSVPDAPRSFSIAGDEDGYARFEAAASVDLGGFSFELGAQTTTDRDLGDDWSAYGRIGKTF